MNFKFLLLFFLILNVKLQEEEVEEVEQDEGAEGS